ncbi:hypothetical protein WL29_22825 [Burkholderia ubonensis]|uniref:Uncharacterized protein n=1 Tax=Burkholderia ubonensis TaxID=101571 RepID=A0A106QDD1_9BURK|nr:hypothetical protein [Burkholderia ubonensis]KWA84198.1 hypothetical protein WL29_22825 [Burkholderia ubonensis]
MKPIDLAALPPSVAELETEQLRLGAAKHFQLVLGANLAAVLAFAIGLASEFTGFDLFMSCAIGLLVVALLYLANAALFTAIQLDNLRPATYEQQLLVEDAQQYLTVSRYVSHVRAQRRLLTSREAAAIIVYAHQEQRRTAATRACTDCSD